MTDDPFDLDAVIAESSHKAFEFTAYGRTWHLTHLSDLDVWPLLESADLGDTAAAKAVLEAAFGDDYGDFQTHPLPQRAFEALFVRYSAFCGVAPGESPASARPSGSTARR